MGRRPDDIGRKYEGVRNVRKKTLFRMVLGFGGKLGRIR